VSVHPKLLAALMCALTVVGCGTKADGGAAAAKSADFYSATRTQPSSRAMRLLPRKRRAGLMGSGICAGCETSGIWAAAFGSEAMGGCKSTFRRADQLRM